MSHERNARWSAVAAVLCALHCATVPFLAAVLPVLAVSSAVEWWAFGVTVAVGGGVTLLSPAWRDLQVASLLIGGAAVWLLALLGLLEPVSERIAAPVGSLLFAGGMLVSARACRRGECAPCAVPDPGSLEALREESCTSTRAVRKSA